MATLRIDSGDLHVLLSTWEKVGALKGDMAVPVTSIERVDYVPNARRSAQGFRALGTGLPGAISLGRWRGRGLKSFVAAYRNAPGYVISLRNGPYDQLVITSPPVPELDAIASPGM